VSHLRLRLGESSRLGQGLRKLNRVVSPRILVANCLECRRGILELAASGLLHRQPARPGRRLVGLTDANLLVQLPGCFGAPRRAGIIAHRGLGRRLVQQSQGAIGQQSLSGRKGANPRQRLLGDVLSAAGCSSVFVSAARSCAGAVVDGSAA